MTEAGCGSPRRRLRIAAGVELDAGSVDQAPATIRSPAWSLPLGVLTPALRDAMVSLIDGSDEEAVASEVQRRGGLPALGRWCWLAQALLDVGGLRCTLTTSAGDPLATISALAPGATLRISPLGVSDSAALSRFACLRSLDGVAVIESPLGRARIELHDPRLAAAVAALARPSTASSIAASIGFSVEALAAFLGFLRGARALAVPGETGAVVGAAGLPLWEFADALFHAHSRLGRRTLAYGATYRFRGRIDPEPAVAPLEGRLIPLQTPNLPRLVAEDPPFAAILEVRRSKRTFARRPVSFAALSEFLYRVARNTESPGPPAGAGEYSWIKRPYPSAGACHPLEVYVAAPRCEDLELGLYRYEPASHGLVAMASDASRLAPLLASARSAGGIAENPPILIVVAARFARTLWKYEGIGYANTLKDAGGLLQTMYLVTTAMGLAGCALGGGDSECFSAAAGAGFFETSSIAEFMLGHPDQEAT